MLEAPAILAACRAALPSPPQPTTTTVSPGLTSARLATDPKPVVTPQLTSAAMGAGTSGSTFMAESTLTTMYSANVPSLSIGVRSLPPES